MTLLKKWKLIVVVKYSRLATTIQKVNLERMRFCKIKTKSLSRWVNKNLGLFWFAVFGSAVSVNQLPKAILRIFFILRTRVIDTLTGLSTMFCITQCCLYRNVDYETKGMKVWWDCHNPGQGWRWEVKQSALAPQPPNPALSQLPRPCVRFSVTVLGEEDSACELSCADSVLASAASELLRGWAQWEWPVLTVETDLVQGCTCALWQQFGSDAGI